MITVWRVLKIQNFWTRHLEKETGLRRQLPRAGMRLESVILLWKGQPNGGACSNNQSLPEFSTMPMGARCAHCKIARFEFSTKLAQRSSISLEEERYFYWLAQKSWRIGFPNQESCEWDSQVMVWEGFSWITCSMGKSYWTKWTNDWPLEA